MSRPLTRLVALATGVLTAGALLVATAPSSQAVARPKIPAGLTSAIEPMAGYAGQVSCDTRTRPGTAKLARLLAATYPVAASWSSTYACGTDGTRSEHYDGRAIDWMVNARKPVQHLVANTVIAWLLAPDFAGNRFAMARRLGVMYVIYNNRMWGAWSGRWEDYNGCSKLTSRANDNWCHRTHMHISLSWNGAMGRTTFWTNRVSPTDYGPCRYEGMNWAPRYAKANLAGCRDYPKVKAPKGASATKRALVTYSGIAMKTNTRGPAVSAVQGALRVPKTARYDARTVAAVKAFQRRVHLPASGRMLTPTWRALLARIR